ncbi:hypothetical protein [Nereida ignava]|uniref:hypothetical protein n=1 Tax=Nereida ignava TaxID=282199 RepID=UPI0030FBCD7B
MPAVPIFFRSRFKAPTGNLVVSCARQNVVLHVCFEDNPYKTLFRQKLLQPTTNAALAGCSNSDPDSPFRHHKYDLGDDGKVLQFQRKRNLIRAGKSTHADAVRSTLLFLRWASPGQWPARMTSPNMVASGRFAHPLPEATKALPCATWSAKFPGVALKPPNSKCTPEVYLKQGTYIIPGVTSPESLSVCLQQVSDMLLPLLPGFTQARLQSAP